MDLLPISIGIARPMPKKQPGASRSKQKLPKDLKQKIMERDGNTCRCCGFTSQKYQEIHFIDHDKNNFSEDNLACVCTFCQQCFNLQDVNDMRSGALVWLPEIEQYQLHHIARAIYVARISQGPIAEAARKVLDMIMKRREEAEKRIQTDDPHILSTVLSDYLPYKHYHYRDKKLEGLRLFPLDRRIKKEAGLEFNQFPQILAYWRSKEGPFGGKTPPQWISIYKQAVKS